MTEETVHFAMRCVALISYMMCLILAYPLPAKSEPDLMTFVAIPPTYAFISPEWDIYASGAIDAKAGERLQAIISKNEIPPASTVYLHSNGGSIGGGLELGRVIRKSGLWTRVGRKPGAPNGNSLPGECYSACALAYIGGVYRFYDRERFRYGVHRFYSRDPDKNDMDLAQVASAQIVRYIREMGVDTRFFDEMVKAGKDDITVISERTLTELRVVNDGILPVEWDFRSNDGIVYLRGMQETWRGTSKIIFGCHGRGIGLVPMIDMGTADKAKETLTWIVSSHIVADGKRITTYSPTEASLTVENFYLSGSHALSNTIVSQILRANSVGYHGQMMNPDLFVGFELELANGRNRLSDLISQCRR